MTLHRIESTRPFEENHGRLRRALGMELRALAWDSPPLRELHEVSAALGIEAWASAGHLYRPFWNGRFGPAQWPSDVDVAVHAQDEVAPLLDALERCFPFRRWSVMCPAERLWRKLGLRAGTLHEAKAFAKLLHKAGAVRWSAEKGAVEAHFADGAEGCLWAGVVRLNDRLLAATEGTAGRVYALDAAGVERAVRDYPGLRVHPLTAERLGGFAASWRPAPEAGAAWRALKGEVVRKSLQSPLAARKRARRRLKGDERALADEIVALHLEGAARAERADRNGHAMPDLPRVDRVDWPEPLESLRRARERKKAGLGAANADAEPVSAVPPEGWSSWLHYLGTTAEDALFSDWFLHQSRHRAPVGGPDPIVRGVLDGSHFARVLPVRARGREVTQTPMHEGWTLPQHLAASVLALRTDGLLERLHGEGHDGAWLRGLRLSLRTALLFHDVGKYVPTAASWRHGRIGARLWERSHPDWFPPQWVPVVAWLVETHDLFGAFARWLTEGTGGGDFHGAVDAQALRAGLRRSGLPLPLAAALNGAVWRADVGSVAALRWLLPVAERVEQVALAGDDAEARPRERRLRPRAAPERGENSTHAAR